jgi:hypothetical protein
MDLYIHSPILLQGIVVKLVTGIDGQELKLRMTYPLNGFLSTIISTVFSRLIKYFFLELGLA